mmetsp:Transcript_68211/g.209162  ORF Transcript_68211/g.209162 Transcript_68211/m.209162 type:complete len:193 (-) Transcript_68211:144-722(-)|eukprot:CAMPEP_0198503558 /NCGR_PEP_ID=MMETSP1462-20131121/9981_1 /TAXON_ID=1333877 /ORGANISM="Brandtodinium nutriculum, Strain RCC3387" /LENGTH=192 /DNA_ID=CAMNT_0044232691 /DNA_START=51 /DNA_END=629 /DNA_ORIENTATION=+
MADVSPLVHSAAEALSRDSGPPTSPRPALRREVSWPMALAKADGLAPGDDSRIDDPQPSLSRSSSSTKSVRFNLEGVEVIKFPAGAQASWRRQPPELGLEDDFPLEHGPGCGGEASVARAFALVLAVWLLALPAAALPADVAGPRELRLAALLALPVLGAAHLGMGLRCWWRCRAARARGGLKRTLGLELAM